MSDKKKPKPAWADEPTPLCGRAFEGDHSVGLLPECADRTEEHEFARDLERRLRHAWKLVNSLRIDAMHDDEVNDIDTASLDDRLSDIEEVLLT